MGGRDNFLRYEKTDQFTFTSVEIEFIYIGPVENIFEISAWKVWYFIRADVFKFTNQSTIISEQRKIERFETIKKVIDIYEKQQSTKIPDNTVSWVYVTYGYILFTLRQVRTELVQRTTAHSIHAHLLEEKIVFYRVKSFYKI